MVVRLLIVIDMNNRFANVSHRRMSHISAQMLQFKAIHAVSGGEQKAVRNHCGSAVDLSSAGDQSGKWKLADVHGTATDDSCRPYSRKQKVTKSFQEAMILVIQTLNFRINAKKMQ
jgi:hypothetical protein